MVWWSRKSAPDLIYAKSTLGLTVFFSLVCCAVAGNTGFVYHPDYILHDPGAGHPERPARLESILLELNETGLYHDLTAIAPEPVDQKWLLTVHTAEYIETLQQSTAKAPVYLDPDTGLSEHSYRVARLATGGVLAAVDRVMDNTVDNAFVAARPPGHHALPDRAMGFCLINHVAVAARYVQQKYGLERVLIVDWDVHHGNGTQVVFYDDPSVFYFSTHQWPYYPGSGAATETGSGAGVGTTLNVPLAKGAGDAEIVGAFTDKLLPAAEAFRPEFVFISAGFDAHRNDPLAGLEVTVAGYRELTRLVMDIAERFADGRIVSVLEGGYNLNALPHSVDAHLRQLSE